jgi:hypothetical protein
MLIVLRGLWGHALKNDWALLKPIVILKVDSPDNRFVSARKLVQHFMSILVRDDEDVLRHV